MMGSRRSFAILANQGSRILAPTELDLSEMGLGFTEHGQPTRTHPLTGEVYAHNPAPGGGRWPKLTPAEIAAADEAEAEEKYWRKIERMRKAARARVARTPLKPIEHGTSRGAQAHRRRGIEVCNPCRDAERKYLREWRLAREAKSKVAELQHDT